MYNKPFHTIDISNLTFLVTGGAGFIGSNIVEYLLKYKAKKVIVLDNLATGFEENIQDYFSLPNFQFIKGDICNIDDCRKASVGVDYVFHQAALGSVPRSIQNPIATHNVNATGFINVLIAARDAKVKRVVYASSSSVYGDSKILPKVEDQIGKQLSPYAVSKMTNELYGEIFAKTYNMEIIGLRYFNIFGPRQNPKGEYAAAIPLFINALRNNQAPAINGDGEQTRDFTFVANAVQANVKAMFAENVNTEGNVFNIAVGERVSLNQLIEILRKLIGTKIQQTYRAERSGDVRDSLADISKAQNILNYQPQIKIEEGLKYTLEWFSRNYK
ncbi:MAG: Vi polysaccharide biosynthesis protein VipB/TviC [Bacteroidetes bacterium RIFCSPLOWO2_12_FULL_35_15]|nr:MAG: Vi polysaccharide biosynthesis protein VipB/TviC [Bacteroidetes bacterium RIFCSPLOWO2_12_FULL_35_15]